MGVHADAVRARLGRLYRGRTSGRLICLRVDRRVPARSARAAAERTGEWRAPQAGRRAGGDPPPLDSPRQRLRRSGPVVGPEGRLERPLDVNGGAGSLMADLPVRARVYVLAVIAAGALLLIARLPHAQLDY